MKDTTKSATTMTNEEHEQLVRSAVRVRSLVDPLGAMGFRTTSTRVDREARWRRAAFAATGFCFASVLSAVIIGAGEGASLGAPLSSAPASFGVTTSATGPTFSTARQSDSWKESEDDDDDVAGWIQVLPPQDQADVILGAATDGRTGGS